MDTAEGQRTGGAAINASVAYIEAHVTAEERSNALARRQRAVRSLLRIKELALCFGAPLLAWLLGWLRGSKGGPARVVALLFGGFNAGFWLSAWLAVKVRACWTTRRQLARTLSQTCTTARALTGCQP